MAPKNAQTDYVSVRAVYSNGRCKRHGGASTGPKIRVFGKGHHRYAHGLRTKEVIAMRKLVADMHKSLRGL